MSSSMPTTDLHGWRLLFTDNFDLDVEAGKFPTSKWTAYPSPWHDSSKHGTYDPSIVQVHDSVLTEHVQTTNGVSRVAAILPRLPWRMHFGRFACRFRFDPLPGYKIAFMLWPDDGLSHAEGEVDFPEMNLNSPMVWAFDHHTASTGSNDQAAFNSPITGADWHVAVIEWSPDLLVFILDGHEIGRTSIRVPATGMHWVLQTETAIGGPAPDPTVAGNVQLDWVAAWKLDPSATGPPAPRWLGLAVPPVCTGPVVFTTTTEPTARIRQVKWVVDGFEVGWSGTPTGNTWTTKFNSLNHPNGIHEVYTKGMDEHGWYDGPTQTFTVRN